MSQKTICSGKGAAEKDMLDAVSKAKVVWRRVITSQ